MVDHPSEDAELVRSALAGEPSSRTRLVERLMVVPRMLREINRRKGSPLVAHDVEDLSQDVLILVWKKLHRFGEEGTLDPWLYRFCQLEFMNHYRGHRRRARNASRLAEEARSAPEPTVDPRTEASALPEGEKLGWALAELSPEERQVIQLRHGESMSFPEMGAHLGESHEAVKARYYRALQSLRRRLIPPTGQGPDPRGGR